jgi:hypothetical protein
MLREIGLEDWVTSGEPAYLERAIRLGRDPDFLAAQATRLAEVTLAGQPFSDTARYAAKLAPALSGLLAQWDQRSATLHALPEAERANRIGALAPRPNFSALDLLEEVVVPYLRQGGRRRFIHVGTGFEASGRSLIEENWLGILFGPDGRPASRPGTAPAADPDIGMAALIEHAAFNDADLIRIDAAGNDFVLLASLNFGAIAPRLIMVSLDTARPGQSTAETAAILAGMRANGYRAALFGLAPDPRTGLIGIAIDQVPTQLTAGAILFFRSADGDFLPSLLGWLEDGERTGRA